jgi:sporulation integral membrane protein YtvI
MVGGALFLTGKYVFPLIFPFLLGFTLAYLVEPVVRQLEKRLPRGVASGLGVTFGLFAIFLFFSVLGGLLGQLLRKFSAALPSLAAAAQESSRTLENFLLGLAGRAPEGLRDLLRRGVLSIFDGGWSAAALGLEQLPRMLSGILSHLPGGALAVCTAVVSAYLLSQRMPRLAGLLQLDWVNSLLPTLKKIRSALGGWLLAQAKLAGLTLVVCWVGFFLLGIPYAPVWAAVVALVDAVPLLGSGLVLVPWSLVRVLQGEPGQAAGLLGIFITAFLLRTVLEPRLVGKQMGLDPLVTLVALYLGFRLGGFWGLVLSPALAVTAMELTRQTS